MALLAFGETFAGLSHTFGDRFPAPTDVASVGDYLPLAVAVLWIGHPPSPRKYLSTALDAAVLTLAGALLAWITVVRPTIAKLHLNAYGRDLIILDWATFVATVAVAVLLILTWRANRSALLLGAAIIALLTSDVLQSIALLHGSTRETTIDGGFIVFCALAGLAALDPAMNHITSVGSSPEQLGVWHFIALAAALLIPPSILLAETTNGPVRGGVAIAVIAAVIGLLMLARVTIGVRALRERTIQERTLREAVGMLGVVQTTDGVIAVVDSAARSMLPAGNTTVSLQPPDNSLTDTIEVRETLGGNGFLRYPISVLPSDAAATNQSTGELRFSGPASRLFALRPAMTTLANQARTALARIRLADAAREHQRDSYFRTLVQNSSDVILICRDGAVDYATPAAQDLFAHRAVVGSRVDDLIAVADPESTSDAASTDATVAGPDGPRRVDVRRQDLTKDPTIHGIVLTLHDITEQQRLHDELTHQATHDTLTGLPNRQLLDDQLRTIGQVANAEVYDAALFIDLDHLKEVNDTLGHQAGDELLKIAAGRIRGCLHPEDLAARLGGDEFAILLRNLHTVAAARDLAERLVDAFRRPFYLRDMSVNSTVSIGIADARTRGEHATLLRRADIAVYAAKAAGKDTWREHPPDLPDDSQTVQAGSLGVDDQIRVHYQPIIDLTTGRTAGFEALTRTGRPGTTPADFNAEAEHRGLIVAVGDRVLETVLRDMPILASDSDQYISVNVSPVQLRHPGFAARILDRLHATGVPPTRLVLELTENLLLDHRSHVWDELAALHDCGIRIALDDFGTASTSLSYLRQRAIDIVKLDRSYLQHRNESRLPAVLSAIVGLTNRLDMDLIAEGIQDVAARDFVQAAGLRYGQGVFFAPALPPQQAATSANPHPDTASQT